MDRGPARVPRPGRPAQGLRRRAQHRQGFQTVLGTTLEDFDKGFFAHLDQRFAAPLAAIRPGAKVVVPGLRAAPTTPAEIGCGPRPMPVTSRPSSPRARPCSTPASARRPSPTSSGRRRSSPSSPGGKPALLPGRDLQGPGPAAGRAAGAAAADRDLGHPLPGPARAGALLEERATWRVSGGLPRPRPLHLAVRARRPRAAGHAGGAAGRSRAVVRARQSLVARIP